MALADPRVGLFLRQLQALVMPSFFFILVVLIHIVSIINIVFSLLL